MKTQLIETTLFANIYDNKVNRKLGFDSWENFVKALHKMSEIPGYKPKRGERARKKSSPLISPAVYKNNSRRGNSNVLKWSRWAALDIDEYEGSFEDVLRQFDEYSYVCYSSASSTKEHPKFRVIIQLSSEVPHNKISHLWYAINEKFSGIADPQTKDLSRMYYVPAQYPNAYNFIFESKGKKILSPESLMIDYPFVEKKNDFLSTLPDNIKENILAFRRDSLTNTNITWSSYTDCTFVNTKLINEYSRIAYTDGTGRYAFFYKLMVNIAGNAVRQGYPITAMQIAQLAREIDMAFGGRYQKRPLETEANRALEYILRNKTII